MSNATNKPIRVMIGDDHSIVLDAVAMTLVGQGCEIVGKAKTIDDIISMHASLRPDVLVLDIMFSGKNTGLDAARTILAADPAAKIVFLSQNGQDLIISETYKLGGYAFLTKDCDTDELITAVKRAFNGQLYFMPGTAEILASTLLRGEPEQPSPIAALEQREVEIFLLMAKGFTNEEIAEQFGLSKRTISQSSQNIKDKLNLHRPADLTLLAVRLGLIELSVNRAKTSKTN